MRRLAALGAFIALLVGAAAAQEPYGVDPRAGLAFARAEERGVLDQLEEIDRQLTAVQTEQLTLEDRVIALETTRQENEQALSEADAAVEQHEAVVAVRVAALYRMHRQGLAHMLFGAEHPADLRRRSAYLIAILDADGDRMRRYLEAVDARKEAMATVDRDVRALDALKTELEAKALELREQRERRVLLLEDIRSRRELTLRAMAEMNEVRRDFGPQIEALPTPTPAAPPTAAPPVERSAAVSFRQSFGRLPWPVSGRIQRTAEGRGVDIQAEYGTPVRAVFEGVVKFAEYMKGYGDTVVLDHGDYTTVYAHLGGMRVGVGELVQQAQVIGLVGNTGLIDGAGYALSFEVRYHGTPQNAQAWLRPR